MIDFVLNTLFILFIVGSLATIIILWVDLQNKEIKKFKYKKRKKKR